MPDTGSPNDQDAIFRHAESVSKSDEAVKSVDRVFQKLEAFIESDAEHFTEAATKYLHAKVWDIRSIVFLRVGVVALSSIACITVMLFLYCSLRHHWHDVVGTIVSSTNEAPHYLTTIVVTLITGSLLFVFGLLALMVKGMSANANDDATTPGIEALKNLIEIVKKITEK